MANKREMYRESRYRKNRKIKKVGRREGREGEKKRKEVKVEKHRGRKEGRRRKGIKDRGKRKTENSK